MNGRGVELGGVDQWVLYMSYIWAENRVRGVGMWVPREVGRWGIWVRWGVKPQGMMELPLGEVQGKSMFGREIRYVGRREWGAREIEVWMGNRTTGEGSVSPCGNVWRGDQFRDVAFFPIC